MVTEKIQVMLKNYFEVLYSQNLTLFDEIFYTECFLFTVQDRLALSRKISEYREIVVNRSSPLKLGSPRNDEILAIDVLSYEMAIAKVRFRLNENYIIAYLNTLKVEGSWKITTILYHIEIIKPLCNNN
jgi:hypothetical protein